MYSEVEVGSPILSVRSVYSRAGKHPNSHLRGNRGLKIDIWGLDKLILPF